MHHDASHFDHRLEQNYRNVAKNRIPILMITWKKLYLQNDSEKPEQLSRSTLSRRVEVRTKMMVLWKGQISFWFWNINEFNVFLGKMRFRVPDASG